MPPTLPHENKQSTVLRLELNALLTSQKLSQKLRLRINQEPWQTFELLHNQNNELLLYIPKSAFKQTYLDLQWEIENPRSPKALGISEDTRLIAVGLGSITLLRGR
jgi:hypothetical protein